MSSPPASANKQPVDLDLLVSLAKRFANLDMYEEAGQLYRIAQALDPESRAVRLGLSQIDQHLDEDDGDSRRSAERELREQFRRNAIDACHFFGLAALYWERQKPKLASECLEIALSKEPIHPFAYKLRGRHLVEAEKWDEAYEALRTAKRFNPFDRQITALLGDVEQSRGNLEESLECHIDAFLLLEEGIHPDEVEELKEKIQATKKRLGLRGPQLAALYRERRIKLQTDFDRLELQRERFLDEKTESESRPDDGTGSRILLAANLRAVELWKELSDVHVFQITRVAKEEAYPAETPIFHQGDAGYDLFLVTGGEIVIRRPTPYGNFELARLPEGTLFGEVNFLTHAERSADAVAGTRTQLVRIHADGLEELMREHPELGVEMYFCFWRGLAEKLRSANEQLRTFFGDEESSDEKGRDEEAGDAELGLEAEEATEAGEGDDTPLPDAEDGPSAGDVAPGDPAAAEKVALLVKEGLTSDELDTLATFSNVKRFDAGSYLFHEGDAGNEMYVVLEGRVMISKYIPGGGEEALAILERGDFFGEMSLVDGQPRSADAVAHGGPARVVAFDELTLREVRQTDAQASIDFIRVLCQMMAQRLREVDEKVTSWRIMAGQRPDEENHRVTSELPPAFAEI